jgi:hypothetical protein
MFRSKKKPSAKNILVMVTNIFPSDARLKAELRSPEDEHFSLGNWVGKEKNE